MLFIMKLYFYSESYIHRAQWRWTFHNKVPEAVRQTSLNIENGKMELQRHNGPRQRTAVARFSSLRWGPGFDSPPCRGWVWSAHVERHFNGGIRGRGKDSAGGSWDHWEQLKRLGIAVADETRRLEEGATLSGSWDPNRAPETWRCRRCMQRVIDIVRV